MKDFLASYGTLFTIFSSWLLVFIGWIVVFNGTKYIASRNEARSILAELSKIIEERLKVTIEYWLSVDETDKNKEEIFYKINILAIDRIKSYNEILMDYGLEILNNTEIINMKKVLTLSPDIETLNDDELYESFRRDKVIDSHRACNELLKKIHTVFAKSHTPIKRPLLDSARFKVHLLDSKTKGYLSNIGGALFGLTIVTVYFFIGRIFLN
ncbi:hypothetical protein [Shewanella oncorhynchi]|uniref:hypothetical protein n=1 Tax=Shewanella oncorhynchi TaxID=2726434 RepID=UPI003D7B2DC6